MFSWQNFLHFWQNFTQPQYLAYGVSVVLLQMLHLGDGERHEFVEVQIIEDVAVPEGAEAFSWHGAWH